MPETITKSQYERTLRQKKIAWAKYFSCKQELLEVTHLFVSQMQLPRVRGELQRPTVLPSHITTELFEMAQKLNKEYSCPICFDLTDKDTIHITWCGHILCKECYEDMKQRNKELKCPLCRQQI